MFKKTGDGSLFTVKYSEALITPLSCQSWWAMALSCAPWSESHLVWGCSGVFSAAPSSYLQFLPCSVSSRLPTVDRLLRSWWYVGRSLEGELHNVLEIGSNTATALEATFQVDCMLLLVGQTVGRMLSWLQLFYRREFTVISPDRLPRDLK